MKLNITNTEKITATIESVEQRCSARTISLDEIKGCICNIESKLSAILSKKDWQGLIFNIDPNAQNFPAAYRGQPESTQVSLERGSSAWFVTSIGRRRCKGSTQQIEPINIGKFTEKIVEFLERSKNW